MFKHCGTVFIHCWIFGVQDRMRSWGGELFLCICSGCRIPRLKCKIGGWHVKATLCALTVYMLLMVRAGGLRMRQDELCQ